MNNLNMWLKDDIANVIQGIAVATPYMGVERSPAEAASFQDGFTCALASVAISLGIGYGPLADMSRRGECRVTRVDGPYTLDRVTDGIPRLTSRSS